MSKTAETVPPWRAVVDDVLKWLNTSKLSTNVYLGVRGATNMLRARIADNLGAEMQSVVDELQPYCHVCFVGACVLSKARVLDKLLVGEVLGPDLDPRISTEEGGRILDGVFDPDDLNLMEAAFMADPWYFTYYSAKRHGVTTTDREDKDSGPAYGAALFGWEAGGFENRNLEDRVRAVMANVIENDGRFVVPPRTKDEWEKSGADNYR